MQYRIQCLVVLEGHSTSRLIFRSQPSGLIVVYILLCLYRSFFPVPQKDAAPITVARDICILLRAQFVKSVLRILANHYGYDRFLRSKEQSPSAMIEFLETSLGTLGFGFRMGRRKFSVVGTCPSAARA